MLITKLVYLIIDLFFSLCLAAAGNAKFESIASFVRHAPTLKLQCKRKASLSRSFSRAKLTEGEAVERKKGAKIVNEFSD